MIDQDAIANAQAKAGDLIRLLTDIANGTNPEDIRSDLEAALPDLQELVNLAEDLTE